MPNNEKHYEQISSFPISNSIIETIDKHILEWVRDTLHLSVATNRGRKPVTVIWAGAERFVVAKRTQTKGPLKLPLIAIERTSISKDLGKWGPFSVLSSVNSMDKRGGYIPVYKEIEQKKSNIFSKADIARTKKAKSDKRVYKVAYRKAPVYLNLNYNLHIKTEYMQQMVDIQQYFLAIGDRINYFHINADGHIYEGFIDGNISVTSSGAELGSEERKIECTITLRILADISGYGSNDKTPDIVFYETATQFSWGKEREEIL